MISSRNVTPFPFGGKRPKKVQEKKEQYKDATIRNKFTQIVNVITYNTITIQTMPHPCTCLESR